MRIGTFRHYVTIQHNTAAAGAVLPTWSTFMSKVPCNVFDVSGGESIRGRQMQQETTVLIETRYYPSLTHAMRVVYDGRNLNILAILDRDGKKHFLDIQCGEART